MSNNGKSHSEAQIKLTLDNHDDRIMDAEIAIQKLYNAFPGADVDGHRRYHDLIIENTAEKRRLRIAILERSYSGAVWALIIFMALAAWNYFKDLLGLK